jgi:hypothetical protein
MDKHWKLQRYRRKDYSELVEFPVEIVGRDGMVRRYSFEDSIRLYQRRITFAPIRYRDGELVRAEVGHCRGRIEQLRRSYFHRFGWGTPDGKAGPYEAFGDLAGELAAFVCRVLRCDGRPELQLDLVLEDDDGVSVWYLTPAGAPTGMLLYVHRFLGSDVERVRERFFSSLKTFERAGRCEGDGERLIAFHHTVDCGFVLTGRGAEYASLVGPRDVDGDTRGQADTPWDGVLEVIRHGDYEQALNRCRELVEEHPWHRNAYVAGAMLANHLGLHVEAEELALLGTRYFPKDGALFYYYGLAAMRQGKGPDAEDRFARVLELAPELVAARSLLVVLLLRRRAFTEALIAMRHRSASPDDRRADLDLSRLETWTSWRYAFVGSGLLLMLMGALAVALVGAIGAVPLFGGVLVLGGGWLAMRRSLDEIVERLRVDEVAQALRRSSWRPSVDSGAA